MKLGFYQVMAGSITDQSDQIRKAFTHMCRGRHEGVLMCSDEKRCRYCTPIEEHEEDHPLFWKGNRPVYNEDGSWK